MVNKYKISDDSVHYHEYVYYMFIKLFMGISRSNYCINSYNIPINNFSKNLQRFYMIHDNFTLFVTFTSRAKTRKCLYRRNRERDPNPLSKHPSYFGLSKERRT